VASREHLNILSRGADTWNAWRTKNRAINLGLERAALSGANLREMNLRGVNLSIADLREADLRGANLSESNLSWADLSRANLSGAILTNARLRGVDFLASNLSRADLRKADLGRADLSRANLQRANLRKAKLNGASLVETNLNNANLSESVVYGISVWKVKLEGTEQSNLTITPESEATITVDNLEVAQFIYLLLNNQKIRDVIDTVTSKAVLILGRFTPKRKAVLNALREELRNHDYLPILFDFDVPRSRDTHETVTTLARLVRFIIADITDPKSIPQELVSIVQTLPSVPVQPLLQDESEPWGMYDHIRRFQSVLKIHRYHTIDDLLVSIKRKIITPAETKAKILSKNRR
jgi:uncharacterized protein YjbI with pentapeptide repeats